MLFTPHADTTDGFPDALIMITWADRSFSGYCPEVLNYPLFFELLNIRIRIA
jgi:hypothetical protein